MLFLVKYTKSKWIIYIATAIISVIIHHIYCSLYLNISSKTAIIPILNVKASNQATVPPILTKTEWYTIPPIVIIIAHKIFCNNVNFLALVFSINFSSLCLDQIYHEIKLTGW